MFKKLSDLASMMHTAAHLGERLESIKQQMEEKRVRGRACHGDHEVLVELNGLGVVQSVEMSDSLMRDPSHKSLAQQLVLESMNQAVAAAKELHVHAMKELTHSLNIRGFDHILEEMAR